MRKRKPTLWPWIITLLLFLLAAGYLEIRDQFKPLAQEAREGNQKIIEVPPNASTGQIAQQLENEGLIRSALAFRIYTRYNNVDGSLKPGTYVLNPAMSIDGIIEFMLQGPDDTIKITIPEGFTVAQIARLMEQMGLVEEDEFLRLTDRNWDYGYLDDIPVQQNRLEGYLFPDTYHITPATEPEKLLDMMLEKFNAVIEENNYINRAADKGLTLHQAVTMASMVEREARVAGERERIAGVIFNRMEMGMPLQIDATIQYVLETPRDVLLYEDLEVDSPYNTYRHPGLPPGPIASPGWPSMLAVVEPEKTDYLYYVAKPDGSHAFARTLAEHNQNISKYQQ